MKLSSFVHLVVLFLASFVVQHIWDYTLETAITILIFYEVGGEVPFLDEILGPNKKLITFLKRRLDKKTKRNRKHRKDAEPSV